ncbi:elongation factor Ts [Dokdonia pacifica]|uniref:Elongation factor Ts n=1 Tax=Dokdonia pacifica TaxID=1627892 RepID=A0A239AEV5_9FLAO|nr:translation elongation factor Ts [Dokdonia pacifica]GGG37964.1 elongation factor Ts [Dokdonia pacifica]SNR93891.1 translation elongation factor Ts (EF-Ts) [Dokdonia pacifica]
MAKITAADVNKLRKSTGAGMMDCKKALVEAEGDFDKAITILRKKGQKIAEKRADRDSSEGAVVAKINDDNTRGVVVSLNCETDFVAKNDSFVAMARQMADIALGTNSKEEFLAADFEGMTVAEKLTEQTGVIGEKIEIGGFKTLEAPFVGSYVHGNKIGALVGLSAATDVSAEVAKSVSMQVASMGATTLSYKDFDPAYVASETEARIAAIEKDNVELGRLGKTLKNVPQYISMSQLTPEVLTKAEDDIKAQLQAEGKPEKIWDKIVPGKLERFISDNTTLDHEKCLLDQRFIMDESLNVADYVTSKGDLSVTGFERVSLA